MSVTNLHILRGAEEKGHGDRRSKLITREDGTTSFTIVMPNGKKPRWWVTMPTAEFRAMIDNAKPDPKFIAKLEKADAKNGVKGGAR